MLDVGATGSGDTDAVDFEYGGAEGVGVDETVTYTVGVDDTVTYTVTTPSAAALDACDVDATEVAVTVAGMFVDDSGVGNGGACTATEDAASGIELVGCAFIAEEAGTVAVDDAPVSTACPLWVATIFFPALRSFI